METILARCAGLDVHKESVEACVRRIEPNGRVHRETRHWGTMTRDLLEMADWLAAEGVTNVAMGVHGSVLEAHFQHLGGSLHRAASECAASEAGAGAQERRAGLPVDRAIAAMWTAERQLHSLAYPARVARPHAEPDATGGRVIIASC
jgi:hypothetical protein